MKKLLTILFAALFAATSFGVLAQDAAKSAPAAEKKAKGEKKAKAKTKAKKAKKAEEKKM